MQPSPKASPKRERFGDFQQHSQSQNPETSPRREKFGDFNRYSQSESPSKWWFTKNGSLRVHAHAIPLAHGPLLAERVPFSERDAAVRSFARLYNDHAANPGLETDARRKLAFLPLLVRGRLTHPLPWFESILVHASLSEPSLTISYTPRTGPANGQAPHPVGGNDEVALLARRCGQGLCAFGTRSASKGPWAHCINPFHMVSNTCTRQFQLKQTKTKTGCQSSFCLTCCKKPHAT